MIQQTKESKNEKKQLKIEDFRHAGNENKRSRQDQPLEEKLLIGAKFPLYHL